MDAILRILATVIVTAGICLRAGAQSAPPNPPAGFRLVADLRDGSRIVGTTGERAFSMVSGAGDFPLPLEDISTVRWQPGSAIATIAAPDGTVKHEQLRDDYLQMQSSLGRINVPLSSVSRLTVSGIRRLTVPREGLVGFWSAEGDAVDSAGAHDGTLENVRFVNGVVGRAFSFNPNSGIWTGIKIPDSPAFELTNSLSIIAWARPRGDGYIILFRGDHRPGMDPYLLGIDGQGNLGFSIFNAGGESVAISAPLETGAWTHVAAVLNDDGGIMSLYTNGVIAARTNTGVRPFGALLPDQSPGFGIGNLNDGGNNFPFAGDLDEIGLYSRALTSAEIQSIYLQNAANTGERAEPFPAPAPTTELGIRRLLNDANLRVIQLEKAVQP